MLFLAQEIPNIEEKLKQAPNSDYEIGVLIGSLLPVTVLILLAYLLYSYMKRKKGDNDITPLD